MAETPYVETNLLLAIMNEDVEEATRLAQDMFRNERRTAAEQAQRMADLLQSFCDACDQPIPSGGAKDGVPCGERLVAEWALSDNSRASTTRSASRRRCVVAESTAARDRALKVVDDAIYNVNPLAHDEETAAAEAVAAVDALLARPEVLRALAGVPDVTAVLAHLVRKYRAEAKRRDEAWEYEDSHDGHAMRGAAAAYSDVADELEALLGATNPPEEGNR